MPEDSSAAGLVWRLFSMMMRVFLLLEEADKEGFGGGDNIMFYAILDEELEAEGGDLQA